MTNVTTLKPRAALEAEQIAEYENAQRDSMLEAIRVGLVEPLERGEIMGVMFATIPAKAGDVPTNYISESMGHEGMRTIGMLEFIKARLTLMLISEAEFKPVEEGE